MAFVSSLGSLGSSFSSMVYDYQLSINQSHEMIIDAIINKRPLAVGKLGANECRNMYTMLIKKNNTVYNTLKEEAGVFPLNEDTVFRFLDIYREHLPRLDIILEWIGNVDHICNEEEVLNEVNYQSYRVNSFDAIHPFSVEENWTNYLRKKRVLAITSHIHSISKQYHRLKNIWNSSSFVFQYMHQDQPICQFCTDNVYFNSFQATQLECTPSSSRESARMTENSSKEPDFTLILMKSPWQPQYEDPEYSRNHTWVTYLEKLSQSIQKIDYDIMLVGAGAYSIPLISLAKLMGKVGIHLGGSIQLLFGIKGRRWDKNTRINSLYNEHWIRPLFEDTPIGVELIEGACYW